MTDAAAMGSIFLVCDAHNSFAGGVECFQGSCIGDDGVSVVIEGDVAGAELLRAASIVASVACVFTDS